LVAGDEQNVFSGVGRQQRFGLGFGDGHGDLHRQRALPGEDFEDRKLVDLRRSGLEGVSGVGERLAAPFR